MCHRKCVAKGCSPSCAEDPELVIDGVAHAHLCAVHRDMSVEAEAARLENAIRAAPGLIAASSGIDWTRTEGAALYAAVLAAAKAIVKANVIMEENIIYFYLN